jgi:hypothetical protein
VVGFWRKVIRSARSWGSRADSKPWGIREWAVLVKDFKLARGRGWSVSSRVLIVMVEAVSEVRRPV